MDIGLMNRPVKLHIGWRPGKKTLCRSRLYLRVRDYEFGYSCVYNSARSPIRNFTRCRYPFREISSAIKGKTIRKCHFYIFCYFSILFSKPNICQVLEQPSSILAKLSRCCYITVDPEIHSHQNGI